MADSKTLQFIIEGEDRSKAAIESAKKSIDGIMKKVDDMQPAFQKMALGGGIAFAAISAFAAKTIGDFADAEASQKMLEHAVIGVTHATQAQLQATMDLADALERKGVLDGDNIKQGLAQLSTFGLSNDAVRGLGGSLADLAVNQFGVKASGDQLADSANMIAKALNGQFGVLEKSGIRFTAAQQHIIKFGTEMQKVDAINQGFAQNLKFTNEVARGTTEGKMAHAAVAAGNLSEAIGGSLKPAVEKLTEAFSPLVEKLAQWATENPKLVAGIILMTAAVTGTIAVIGTLGVVVGSVTALSAALGITLLATVGWMVAIPIAIAAVIAAGVLIYQNWDTIKAKAIEVWGWISPYVEGVLRALLGAMTFGLSEVVISFVQNWDKIKTNTTGFWDWIKPYLQIAVRAIVGVMTLGLSEVAISVYNNWDKIKTGTGEMVSNTIAKIKGWAIGIAEGAASMKNKVVTFVSDLWEGIKTTFSEWTSKALEWGSHFVSNFAQGIYDGTVGKLSGAVESMSSYIKSSLGFSTNPNLPSEVWGQHFMENFAGGMNTGMGSVNGAVTNTITSVQKLKSGVEPEIVSLSKIMDGYTKALDNAKKSHAELQKEGVSSIASLSSSIQTKVGEMVTTLAKLKKDYADIFKDEASSTADNRKNLADAVVASEKTQADLKLQIAQEADANKRGLLQGQLAAEVLAYQANKDLITSISAEVTEARKFASMTQLQQAIQAFNLEKDKILEIKNERLKSYAEELETAKKKLPEIKALWKERNDKLIQFMSSEISKNSDFKNAVDDSNKQVLQLIVALKQLETQQARVGVKMNASISPKMMASGGIVNEPTLAIIGEAGPEAVIPLNKGYGVPSQGGQNINVTITGNSFFGEDDLLAKVEKQLMGVLKANVKLA